MGLLHVYSAYSVMSADGLWRFMLFFLGNGIAVVVEGAIWGRKKGWARAILAWAFEATIASWVVKNGVWPRETLEFWRPGFCHVQIM